MEERAVNFLYRNQTPPPPRRKRRWLVFLCVLLILCGGIYVTNHIVAGQGPNDALVYDPVTLEPVKPKGFFKRLKSFVFPAQGPLEGQKQDRINILLLGMGGVGHDGPFLTDTIIIGSVKPSTGQVAMISIPRDLAIPIPGQGWKKINYVNSIGETKKPHMGAAYAAQVIGDTFNIPIHYYVRLDFTAFTEIIDEVGGIKIHVDRSFTDYQYPTPGDLYQTVSFSAGPQTMDGETALIYGRSRHGNNGEGSDFARAKRQQKMLLALKEKVLSFQTLANPVHLNAIMQSLNTHVSTNLAFSDMVSLLKLAREVHTDELITAVLDTSPNGFLVNGTGIDGAFILSPKTGNFDTISSYMEHIFTTTTTLQNNTPEQESPTFEAAIIEIQNGTWQAGLAAQLKKQLEGAGFTIAKIGNTKIKPITTSGIYTTKPGSFSNIMQALQQELSIPIKQEFPEGELPDTTTDVLIIIGDDTPTSTFTSSTSL